MTKRLPFLCVAFLLTVCVARAQTDTTVATDPTHLVGRSTKAVAESAATLAATYGHLPLGFEANEGQTDGRVQFLSHTPDYTLFLQPDAATLSLREAVRRKTITSAEARPLREQHSVVRMRLLGASPTNLGEGEGVLPGKTSYLLGKDASKWHANLANYRRVKYRGVYPGIDLVYYGTNGQLEYDFELSANADPAQIRMHFDGVTPSITAAGDVNLKLDSNSIVLHRPLLYQQIDGHRTPVEGTFALNRDGDLGFVTGSYDHSVPLVIDPLLQFSSYLGGVTANNTVINGMAVDATGAVYVTGMTSQTDFPVTVGGAITTCPSNANGSKCGPFKPGTAFVSKIAADGQSLVYSTYMGGNDSQGSSERGNAIAVTSSGEAWVAGITSSPSFPITSDAIQSICSPVSPNIFVPSQVGPQNSCSYGTSQFLVKLNASGSAVSYGTFLGGGVEPYPSGVALDANGNVYVAGTDPGGSFASTSPYTRNGVYITDSAGNYLYPTTTNAFQQVGPEQGFAYLTKLSADGHTLLYSTIFEPTLAALGSGQQPIYALSLAVSGSSAIIGGYTNSILPTTAGAVQSSCTLNSSGTCLTSVPWLASFDTTKSGSASLVFATYLDGSPQLALTSQDQIGALAADANGNIFAGGFTQQPLFPTTTGAFQPACTTLNLGFGVQCNTGFVTKLTPAGAIVWSTFFGSPTANGQDGVSAIALDTSDNVYITNGAAPSDMPTNGGLMAYVNGAAYIAELSSDGTREPFGSFYGNGGAMYTSGIAVSAANDIFVSGFTTGSVPLLNAYQSANSNGYNEGFFAKISHLSATATTLTVSPAATIPNQPITFTATVAGTAQTNAAPTGTVTLTNTSVMPNATLGSIQLTNGTGTFSTSQLPVGVYSVTGTYSGDALYNTSTSSAAALTIHTPAPASIALTVPPVASLGASVILGATVSASAGTPTGTVSFYSGGVLVGSGILSNGKTTYSTTLLGLGLSTITALYSGDNTFGSAPSTPTTIDITTTAAIALTAPATVTLGGPITLSVVLTGSGAAPTGSVTFLDGAATLNTTALSAGRASYTTSALAVGAHTITVQYGGDANYNALTSTAQTVTISPLTPVIALTVPATANVGSSVALSVAVSGSGVTPTGTVKFLDGTTTLNIATLSGGRASFSTSSLSVGAHSITVQYSGDGTYSAGASTAASLSILTLTPAVALTVSPTTVLTGASISLSATVTSAAGTPTGTVNFLDGTKLLNTATLVSGTATYSAASLAVGTHAITASYSGDATFAPVTTAAQTVTITAIQASVILTAAPSSLTIARGGSGTTVITATPAGGYTGTLALSCGTTQSFTCTFSVPNLAISGTSAQTSTLTVSTTSTQSKLEELPRRRGVFEIVAALLLPMLLVSRRRANGRSVPWIVLPALLLGIFAAGALTGCGGSGSTPVTTAPGSYAVTVNATAGSTASSLSLQITVQ